MTAVTGDLLLPGAAQCTATPQTCRASHKAKFRVSVYWGECQGQPAAAGSSNGPGRASCCPSHLCFVPDNYPPSFNHDNLSHSQKWDNHGASMFLPTTVLELECQGPVTSLRFGWCVGNNYLDGKHTLWLQNTAFVNDKTMPDLYSLVNRYKPDLIWSLDG